MSGSVSTGYSDAQVAASYDRLLVPHHFAAPARELVTILGIPVGGRVLDVGSGTGAAAISAAHLLGPGGLIVALDPSMEMLQVLQRKDVWRLVAGRAPGLPFPDGRFDAVLANFVLSHFNSYELALKDMVRVLRPGGRLGVTSWGPGQTEFVRVWEEVAGSFFSIERLQQAVRESVPWDEWFKDETHIHKALEGAELVGVEVKRQDLRVTISLTDYLSLRETTIEGRLLLQEIGAEQCHKLRRRMLAVFRSRVKEPIEYSRKFFLAFGIKPSPQASPWLPSGRLASR